MALHMLTTVDNPYDPNTQWDEWNRWDEDAGYNTNSLLARITITSYELSEADQDQALEDAMEEIERENVSGMHKRVVVPTS